MFEYMNSRQRSKRLAKRPGTIPGDVIEKIRNAKTRSDREKIIREHRAKKKEEREKKPKPRPERLINPNHPQREKVERARAARQR